MQKIFSLIDKYQHLFRFLVVGGLCFALDYGTLELTFHLLKFPLALSTNLGLIVGVGVNFVLNKFWTFKASHDAKQSTRQAVLYGILVGVNLLLTNWIVLSLAGLHVKPELGKPISAGVIMCTNFFMYKWVVFKKQPVNPEVLEEGLL
ncbi:MAG TPA: GtrA family protein [Candidatus Acidoferrum sp.]|nr:GtrA family protein [Candidatus Acidoferrum sp.]